MGGIIEMDICIHIGAYKSRGTAMTWLKMTNAQSVTTLASPKSDQSTASYPTGAAHSSRPHNCTRNIHNLHYLDGFYTGRVEALAPQTSAPSRGPGWGTRCIPVVSCMLSC